MCIVAPVEESDKRFIMDSGSGHDLISRREAIRMELDMSPCEPIVFHTATGIPTAECTVDVELGTMKDKAQVQVLDDTPSVFSIGKRFMNEGYAFIWPPGQVPYMVNREGKRINMVIKDLIPYDSLRIQGV